ncbi:ShlB/FhaC/HecB family hemolysin secretion/activation protein [Hylemonella gracilis]|uniref:ShlB/FhaC/HecB family hemolysin secretion/activation protein n=1 Tax=Hylemonella gracilis TaxID=80880 RepID=UPI0012DFD1F0|nr:ShlB/FhaC/HecB family hemolysin secretion/activation protein [Hylemonella gracilis]
MARGWRVLLLVLWAWGCWAVRAQALDQAAQDEWLRRQQREAQEQQRREQRPDFRFDLPEPQASPDAAAQAEDFCFQLDHIRLEGEVPSGFGWLQDELRAWQGRCLGQQGLAQLLKNLNGSLLARGFVTSRLAFPEQDLKSGTLVLHFFPGYLNQIRLPQDYRGSWRTAFPARHGDVLNLRDLEQGLEQMKRLASQDVQMQIKPSEQEGYSDVEVSVTTTRPWSLSVTLDDSGGDATGKNQWAAQAGWNNPLGLQDQIQLGWNRSSDYDAQQGTRSHNVYYGIPWGYWLVEASYNTFSYHQQVEGDVLEFMSSGDGYDVQLDATRTVLRDNRVKTDLFVGLGVRRRHSYIEDAEIMVQQRRLSQLQLGVRHRHYLDAGSVNLSLTGKQGLRIFNAESGLDGPDAPGPTYRLVQASAGLNQSFPSLRQPVWLSSQNRVQWSDKPLYSLDWFSVGGRHTVRGFSGENSLGGQRGWLSRNELGHTWWRGHDVFVAIDVGGVSGLGTESYDGRWLAGGAVGWRGRQGPLQYEAFVAHGLHAPASFKDEGLTGGFALTWHI